MHQTLTREHLHDYQNKAVEDSVDMTVLTALEGKNTTQKALLDALKEDCMKRKEIC